MLALPRWRLKGLRTQEVVGVAVVMRKGRGRVGLMALQSCVSERLHPSKWPQVVIYIDRCVLPCTLCSVSSAGLMTFVRSARVVSSSGWSFIALRKAEQDPKSATTVKQIAAGFLQSPVPYTQ
jgi:hypothetical protein